MNLYDFGMPRLFIVWSLLLVYISQCHAIDFQEICKEVMSGRGSSHNPSDFIKSQIYSFTDKEYELKLERDVLLLLINFTQVRNEPEGFIDCSMGHTDFQNFATIADKFNSEPSIVIPGKLLPDLIYACKETVQTCYEFDAKMSKRITYVRLYDERNKVNATIYKSDGTVSHGPITKPQLNDIESLRFNISAYTTMIEPLPIYFAFEFKERCRGIGHQMEKLMKGANDRVIPKKLREVCSKVEDHSERDYNLQNLLNSQVSINENYRIINHQGYLKIIFNLTTTDRKHVRTMSNDNHLDLEKLHDELDKPLTISVIMDNSDFEVLNKLCLKREGSQCKIKMSTVVSDSKKIRAEIQYVLFTYTQGDVYLYATYYVKSRKEPITQRYLIFQLDTFYSLLMHNPPSQHIHMMVDITYCPDKKDKQELFDYMPLYHHDDIVSGPTRIVPSKEVLSKPEANKRETMTTTASLPEKIITEPQIIVEEMSRDDEIVLLRPVPNMSKRTLGLPPVPDQSSMRQSSPYLKSSSGEKYLDSRSPTSSCDPEITLSKSDKFYIDQMYKKYNPQPSEPDHFDASLLRYRISNRMENYENPTLVD